MNEIKKNYYYQVFGLKLKSDLEFPALPRSDSEEFDITITQAKVDFPFADKEQAKFKFDDGESILAWKHVATYRIVGTDRIEIDPNPETDIELLALPLFGRVFATLLHLRGNLVLHASAVSVDEAGFALLGDKGAGKSTTATAFIDAGHQLVSDDVVSLSFDSEGAVICQQAFAEVKLWDDASSRFQLDADQSDYILNTTKRKQWLKSGFRDQPVEMKAIYILDRKDEAKITKLSNAEAFQALLRFSYLADFGFKLFKPEVTENHMKLCASVSNALDVCRLTVPTGLEHLGEVVASVENMLSPGRP